MKILIPNATSPKNIGDLAMLTALISLVEKNNTVKIHSSEPQLYSKIFKKSFSPTVYDWAVYRDRRVVSRIKRVLELLINYNLLRFIKYQRGRNQLQKLINDYREADLIIYVGGGYLRSQKGIKQTLNLLMTLFLFKMAKYSSAKIIIAPMSFGPFAHTWQEKYTAKVIKNFDLIATREKKSYDVLRKYNIKNLINSCDMALFLNIKSPDKPFKKNDIFILGFTFRKWLNPMKQRRLEKSVVNSIIELSKTTNLIVQPIVQVNAPEYGDIDAILTDKIATELRKTGIKVRKVEIVKDLGKSANIYGQLDLLLGMRMHSNILAFIQGTPFVAISYEHKTEGISDTLGMGDYCVKIEEANKDIITSKLKKAFHNNESLRSEINNTLNKIRSKEIVKWQHILSNLNSM